MELEEEGSAGLDRPEGAAARPPEVDLIGVESGEVSVPLVVCDCHVEAHVRPLRIGRLYPERAEKISRFLAW